MTTEELMKLSEDLYPSECYKEILEDAAVGISADFDWSYYNCNEADISISTHVGEWAVVRTFLVSMTEMCTFKRLKGRRHKTEMKEYIEYISSLSTEDCQKVEDTYEPIFEVKIGGEWARLFVNVRTGEEFQLCKQDKNGKPYYRGRWKMTDEDYFENPYLMDVEPHPALIERGYKQIFCYDCDTDLFNFFLHHPYSGFLKTILTNDAVSYIFKKYEDSAMKIIDNDNYITALKIANRHHYEIKNMTKWTILIDILSKLGKDLHNPFYVCSDNIDADITKYGKIAANKTERERRMREQEERKRNMENIKRITSTKSKENANYIKHMKGYFDISISGGNFTIKPLKSVKEFYEEGTTMKHCVYAQGYYKRFSSLILSVKDNDGNRLATIELDLNRMDIKQCYAHNDQVPERDKEFREAVMDNIGTIEKIRRVA